MQTGSILEDALAQSRHFRALAERLTASGADSARQLDEARRLNAGYRDQIRLLSQEVEARDLCISLMASRTPSFVRLAKIEVASTWRGDLIPFIRRAGDGKGSTPETAGPGGGAAGG